MEQEVVTVGLDLAKNVFQVHAIEPPRDCRRPFGLSYAAMETSSSMA